MKILFDHGVPAPLRRALASHEVATAFELGWQEMGNGRLLDEAEKVFAVLITTDKNIRHQQNLAGRKLSILVLPTTSWPQIQKRIGLVCNALNRLKPGGYIELEF